MGLEYNLEVVHLRNGMVLANDFYHNATCEVGITQLVEWLASLGTGTFLPQIAISSSTVAPSTVTSSITIIQVGVAGLSNGNTNGFIDTVVGTIGFTIVSSVTVNEAAIFTGPPGGFTGYSGYGRMLGVASIGPYVCNPGDVVNITWDEVFALS